MRYLLKMILWMRFGSAYGDAKLDAVRQTLFYRCWSTYEQMRQGGASPMTALRACLPTYGQVAAARGPHIREGMAKVYYSRVCIQLILAALLLFYPALVCVRSLVARGFYLVPFLVFFGTAFSIWLVITGLFRLKKSPRKAAAVFVILIGVLLILSNAVVLFLINPGKFHYYDYRDRLENVESIGLVRLDENPKRNSEGDCLQYTVIETAAQEQYEPLLKELAGLRFWCPSFGDLGTLTKGSEMILIRFSIEQNDVSCVFYGCRYPGYVQKKGKQYELTYYLTRVCSDQKWDDLVARYFPNAPLR